LDGIRWQAIGEEVAEKYMPIGLDVSADDTFGGLLPPTLDPNLIQLDALNAGIALARVRHWSSLTSRSKLSAAKTAKFATTKTIRVGRMSSTTPSWQRRRVKTAGTTSICGTSSRPQSSPIPPSIAL
jgi:hypothetical protein